MTNATQGSSLHYRPTGSEFSANNTDLQLLGKLAIKTPSQNVRKRGAMSVLFSQKMIAIKGISDSAAASDETNWMSYITSAQKSCLVENGVRKVHYKLPDGKEMVEEYNLETDVLVRRVWKVSGAFRGQKWDVEVGDPFAQFDQVDSVGIKENAAAPILSKRITKNSIEWRIRNLPYPKNVYSVSADDDGITVRTSNKKYFKKISVPELDRVGIKTDDSLLTFNHQFNTLIITYKKPPMVKEMEGKVLEMVKSISPSKVPDIKDAPEQCRPS